MPSLPHELLVELFRANAALAPALVRAAGIPVAAARAEAGSIDLSQVAPTEYRADAVVVCGDDAGRAVLGVIVEVQARVDRRKEATWPVYAATLRAKLGCPVVVLVVALDAGVAEWARAPLALGPGSYLTPVVVGAAEVPRPADAGEARRVPELAVLAALAHRDEATAALALGAISELPEDVARLYWDAVLAELPAPVRELLEAHMQGYEYRSEFARKYYGEGLAAGRAQGRDEGLAAGRAQGRDEGLAAGRAQGRDEGRGEGLRDAVVTLVEARVGALSPEDRQAIAAIPAAALIEVVGALSRASSADDARAALRAVGR